MSAFRRFDPWLDIVEEPEAAAKAAKPAKAAAPDFLDLNTVKRTPPAPSFSNFSSFSGPAPAKVEYALPESAEPATPGQAEDYHERYEERAAIAEHDGGQDRATAERIAFEDCVIEWLNRNPPKQADPHRCIECGEPLGAWDGLPCLTGGGGHVRLHGRCHPAWMQQRRAAAVAALQCLGLHQP